MNHPNATQSAAIGKALGTRSSVLDMLVDEERKLTGQLSAVRAAIEAIKALELGLDMSAPFGQRAITDGTTDGSAVRTPSGRRPKFGMVDDILRCLRESQEADGVGVQWIATWLAKNTAWLNGTGDVEWQRMVAQHLSRLASRRMIKRVRRGYYMVLRRSPGRK